MVSTSLGHVERLPTCTRKFARLRGWNAPSRNAHRQVEPWACRGAHGIVGTAPEGVFSARAISRAALHVAMRLQREATQLLF